jgi:hypothetical protein
MTKGIKGFQVGRKVSLETRTKISKALSKKVEFECDMCGELAYDKLSHYKRKKRHFCSMPCYSEFRKTRLPKEEQHRFGTGLSKEERTKRIKCRSITNHAIRDRKLIRQNCEVCDLPDGEAHHDDYDRPFDIRWLCFQHHREYHKKHENPELLKS